MKPTSRLPTAILISIFLIIGQLGCAHSPQHKPPSLSEEARAELGTIGLVSAHFVPEFIFPIPVERGKAALAGAAMGGLGTAGGIVLGLGPAVVILAFPPAAAIAAGVVGAGAVIGGVAGAVVGESSKTIVEAETSLNSATPEIQGAFGEELLSRVRDRTEYSLILIEREGPTSLDEKVTYGSLSSQGIDTVLEVTVRRFGLSGEKGFNPTLCFFLTLETRVVRTKDGTEIYNHVSSYMSKSHHKLRKWAAGDAQCFKDEVKRCLQILGTEIVEALFLD